MIFVHPFDDNFGDNFVFLSLNWSKIMEREKGRERIICFKETNESNGINKDEAYNI